MYATRRHRRGTVLTTALAAVLASGGLVVATPPPAAEALPSTATVSTVYYWNDVLLELFRREGGGPGPLTRGAAIMHGGIYDVLNSARWSRQNMVGSGFNRAFGVFEFDPDTDDNLAAGIAARDLLKFAFPGRETYIQQKYAERHGSASQPAATEAAAQVVNHIKSVRTDDGSDASQAYTINPPPGAWRLTPNPDCTAAVDPRWGLVTPFAIRSGSAYRPPLPGGVVGYADFLASSAYTTAFNEVKSLGKSNSTTRTATQTQIAHFWSNDAEGTYKAPGQLLAHTRIVAQSRTADPLHLSRLFARVSFGLADAAIAAWDRKYIALVDLWRPVTAIRLAADDGNPDTAANTSWLPLGPSPCFPSYTSGHATLAGAWAYVMANQYVDSVSYTGTTEDPNAVGVTRTFTSFTAAATEDARSRVYLGVHFQFDADEGLIAGRLIGDQATTKMKYVECPPTCF